MLQLLFVGLHPSRAVGLYLLVKAEQEVGEIHDEFRNIRKFNIRSIHITSL
jgi:hypothetical protein